MGPVLFLKKRLLILSHFYISSHSEMEKYGRLSNVLMVMGTLPLLLGLFFLTGCKPKKEPCFTCLHEVNVPLLHDDPTDYPLLSKLCSSIDTVYLENAGVESLVNSVDEVVSFGDTIIVRSADVLFFFNRQGKFLSRFDRMGKGTGNYRVIERFDVIPSKKELFIMDGHTNKVFVYDMDGTFKRQVAIDDFVTDFVVLPNGDFLFTNPIKYSGRNYRRGLWRTDPDGKFIEQLIEYNPEFAHVSINNPYLNHIAPGLIGFMGVEDNDLFYHYIADTMSVTCRMTTDIVIPDDIKKSDKVFINPEREYTKCGYLETKRFLYFVSTNYGANLVMSLVDKSDWTTYRMYVYSSEFKYKMENVESFPYLVSCYNGTLVGFLDSGMILENEHYRKQFPTITEDSNPVLVFYREN